MSVAEVEETTPEPEPVEPEPAPEEEQEEEETPEPEGRCEAQTTAGGNPYQCSLQAGHDGEHAFQQLEDVEAPPEPEAIDMDKARDKLRNEALRHYKRLGEIMGDDAEGLVPCALCSPDLAGFRFDASPPENVVEAVRAVIGLPDLSNYPESTTEKQCPTCKGTTKVRTGSLDSRFETLPCDDCEGKGFVEARARKHADAQVFQLPTANGEPPPPIDDGVKRDMFGTPETDPDYGKMPNMRARPTDYWQTNRV